MSLRPLRKEPCSQCGDSKCPSFVAKWYTVEGISSGSCKNSTVYTPASKESKGKLYVFVAGDERWYCGRVTKWTGSSLWNPYTSGDSREEALSRFIDKHTIE